MAEAPDFSAEQEPQKEVVASQQIPDHTSPPATSTRARPPTPPAPHASHMANGGLCFRSRRRVGGRIRWRWVVRWCRGCRGFRWWGCRCFRDRMKGVRCYCFLDCRRRSLLPHRHHRHRHGYGELLLRCGKGGIVCRLRWGFRTLGAGIWYLVYQSVAIN